MKFSVSKSILLIAILFIGVFVYTSSFSVDQKKKGKESFTFQTGDVVFQSTDSKQCIAIKLATGSEWSHCGMIAIEQGKVMVYEAVQPMQKLSWNEWVKRGNGVYAAKRPKAFENGIDATSERKLVEECNRLLGKNYDIYFDWTDDQVYCSELVWKVYDRGLGMKLCNLRKLASYSFDEPEVQAILKQRYGNEFPSEMDVVAPEDLFISTEMISLK